MIGHNVPEVVDAIRDQAGRLLHSSTVYLIPQQVALAERIAARSGIPDARVFFTTSGTEANEAALLLATTARRSNQVLALRGSYHGRSYAPMGVTGNRSWSASGFSPLNVSYVQGGYRYRSPFGSLSDDAFTAACVDDLRSVIETTTSGDIAAMIAEPIQGVGGFTVPPDGFFGAMKTVLDEMGILFISDEVQTGWGRTGEHFWGIDAHGVTPDLMTFAKGLGNGIAIAGVVGRAEIMDAMPANSISTFGGNPIATAAALATLDYVETHDLQANARAVGGRLLDGLKAAAPDHPSVGEVRGKGLMIGIELVEPGSTVASPGMATAVMEETRRQGLLIGKGGLRGNVLRLAPPLTLTGPEADEGLALLIEALGVAERQTFGEPALVGEVAVGAAGVATVGAT
jgi:4-aminobutyrate aminotransferase